ncbi:MAG: putative toxin-antitoxin system toxin component, PIN family [Candidatus Dormibacteria bacterium]
MRVVLDTNVLISAYIFPGGTPEAVLRRVLAGGVEMLTSRVLLAEFGRILERKFGWDAAMSEDAVRHVARISSVIEPAEAIAVVVDDPDDDRVLEVAIAGGASIVVSGDRHLLQLQTFRGIRLLTPAAFLDAAGPALS